MPAETCVLPLKTRVFTRISQNHVLNTTTNVFGYAANMVTSKYTIGKTRALHAISAAQAIHPGQAVSIDREGIKVGGEIVHGSKFLAEIYLRAHIVSLNLSSGVQAKELLAPLKEYAPSAKVSAITDPIKAETELQQIAERNFLDLVKKMLWHQ
jgi:hypothetical protein